MSKKRIKKADRAYLYFRENGRGYLNIKFGPEKYAHNTEKFYDVLMVGLLQSVNFLAETGRQAGLNFEEIKGNYDILANAFQAILFEAFPEVKEHIFEIEDMEEAVIEAVESGEKIPVENEEEFKQRVEETKEKLKEQVHVQKFLTEEDVMDHIMKLQEDIDLFDEIKSRFKEGKPLLKKQIGPMNRLLNQLLLDLNTKYEEAEHMLPKEKTENFN